jgi:hypothetical protein
MQYVIEKSLIGYVHRLFIDKDHIKVELRSFSLNNKTAPFLKDKVEKLYEEAKQTKRDYLVVEMFH